MDGEIKFLLVREVAKLLRRSPALVQRTFSRVPGVVDLGTPERMHKRRYRVLRIPRHVVDRFISEERRREEEVQEVHRRMLRCLEFLQLPRATIFVRHSKKCRHQNDKAFKRCRCWKHLRWTRNGRQSRLSTKSRDWAAAEDAKHKLELQFRSELETRFRHDG